MITPTKHITLDASLMGVGAVVLGHLAEPKTLTSLWEAVREIPSVRTFHRFVLTLDFLYILGVIEQTGGTISKVTA